MVGLDTQTASQLVAPLVHELGYSSPRLSLEDSLAEVDLDCPAYLLDGDSLLLEETETTRDPRGGKIIKK